VGITAFCTIFGLELLQTYLGYLRKELKSFSPHPLNCLVFGPKGAGKSALYNTLIASLSKKSSRSAYLIVACSADHVTRSYDRFWVGSFLEEEKKGPLWTLPLHFFDTWGTSDEDYHVVKLKNLISGWLCPGTRRDDLWSGLNRPNYDPRTNKIHVVVLVYSQRFLQYQGARELTELVQEVTSAGLKPLLVLTGDDDSQEMQDRCLRVCSNASLPVSDVFFIRNYTTENFRDYRVDCKALNLLKAIYSRGTDYSKGVEWKWGDHSFAEVLQVL
jgi:hypothetical protein